MIEMTIDGKLCDAKEGSTILEAAIEHDISIPTLCHYEEVSPGGRCKLCTVEIRSPKKKRPLVLSCTARVQQGMDVRTHSEEILASRKEVMAILLDRAPQAGKVQQMAREIGVDVTPTQKGGTGCILCGICVRACKEIVGQGAIHFKRDRSAQKGRETSIEAVPEECIGCGTCAYLCPTGYIKMEDHGDVRIIWNKVFKRKRHLISGKYYAPKEFIRYIEETEGIDTARLKNPTASYPEGQEISKGEK